MLLNPSYSPPSPQSLLHACLLCCAYVGPRYSRYGGGRKLHWQVQPQEGRKELPRSHPSINQARANP